MKKIVLKKSNEPRQYFTGIQVIITIAVFVNILFLDDFFKKIMILYRFWLGRFLLLILILVPLYTFFKMFSRKGVFIRNGKLFVGSFLFKKVIVKHEINLTNITDITYLHFTNHSFLKPAWDRIYLLNRNHSFKVQLLESISREETKLIISFLADNLYLNVQKYNPPRSRNRR